MTSLFFKRDLATSYEIGYIHAKAFSTAGMMRKIPTSAPNWQHNIDDICFFGNMECVEMAYNAGPRDHFVGLHGACRGHRTEVIDFILERKCDLVDHGLYGACRGGHKDLIDRMISLGARDFDQALCAACAGGHREIAEQMIKRGATCLNLGMDGACCRGRISIAEWLISLGCGIQHIQFQDMCYFGHREMVKWFLDTQADANPDDGLYVACQRGQLDVAELLVMYGAHDWNSALSGACDGGKKSARCAQWAIDHGAVRCDTCKNAKHPTLQHPTF